MYWTALATDLTMSEEQIEKQVVKRLTSHAIDSDTVRSKIASYVRYHVPNTDSFEHCGQSGDEVGGVTMPGTRMVAKGSRSEEDAPFVFDEADCSFANKGAATGARHGDRNESSQATSDDQNNSDAVGHPSTRVHSETCRGIASVATVIGDAYAGVVYEDDKTGGNPSLMRKAFSDDDKDGDFVLPPVRKKTKAGRTYESSTAASTVNRGSRPAMMSTEVHSIKTNNDLNNMIRHDAVDHDPALAGLKMESERDLGVNHGPDDSTSIYEYGNIDNRRITEAEFEELDKLIWKRLEVDEAKYRGPGGMANDVVYPAKAMTPEMTLLSRDWDFRYSVGSWAPSCSSDMSSMQETSNEFKPKKVGPFDVTFIALVEYPKYVGDTHDLLFSEKAALTTLRYLKNEVPSNEIRIFVKDKPGDPDKVVLEITGGEGGVSRAKKLLKLMARAKQNESSENTAETDCELVFNTKCGLSGEGGSESTRLCTVATPGASTFHMDTTGGNNAAGLLDDPSGASRLDAGATSRSQRKLVRFEPLEQAHAVPYPTQGQLTQPQLVPILKVRRSPQRTRHDAGSLSRSSERDGPDASVDQVSRPSVSTNMSTEPEAEEMPGPQGSRKVPSNAELLSAIKNKSCSEVYKLLQKGANPKPRAHLTEAEKTLLDPLTVAKKVLSDRKMQQNAGTSEIQEQSDITKKINDINLTVKLIRVFARAQGVIDRCWSLTARARYRVKIDRVENLKSQEPVSQGDKLYCRVKITDQIDRTFKSDWNESVDWSNQQGLEFHYNASLCNRYQYVEPTIVITFNKTFGVEQRQNKLACLTITLRDLTKRLGRREKVTSSFTLTMPGTKGEVAGQVRITLAKAKEKAESKIDKLRCGGHPDLKQVVSEVGDFNRNRHRESVGMSPLDFNIRPHAFPRITLLHAAVYLKDFKLVQRLLASCADADALSDEGVSPRMLAENIYKNSSQGKEKEKTKKIFKLFADAGMKITNNAAAVGNDAAFDADGDEKANNKTVGCCVLYRDVGNDNEKGSVIEMPVECSYSTTGHDDGKMLKETHPNSTVGYISSKENEDERKLHGQPMSTAPIMELPETDTQLTPIKHMGDHDAAQKSLSSTCCYLEPHNPKPIVCSDSQRSFWKRWQPPANKPNKVPENTQTPLASTNPSIQRDFSKDTKLAPAKHINVSGSCHMHPQSFSRTLPKHHDQHRQDNDNTMS